MNSGFKIPPGGQGRYIICYSGLVYNELDQSQNNKMVDFTFDKGEVVELEYDGVGMKLNVRNLTNGKSHTLNNIWNAQKDLYYCVSTRFIGD